MAIQLTQALVKNIVSEVNDDEEKSRRTFMKRRHDIYRDGGKEFLLEQVKREFGKTAVDEMRMAPLNFLKKIINKRSTLYKQPPIRTSQSEIEADQALIDFYTEELDFDENMAKANRYFNLFANTALYVFPRGNTLKYLVVPPYLYSVKPNMLDKTVADIYSFSSFIEEGEVKQQHEPEPGGGAAGFTRDRGFKGQGDVIDSREFIADRSRQHIMWSHLSHVTTNNDGAILIPEGLTIEQATINPIAPLIPVVNLAKDRDDTFWATQGEDSIDISLLLQQAWTDVMTIAKHHGFSLMTIKSEEEPQTITTGINKAIWLKASKDMIEPSIDFIQASSPLAEYKDLLMELLGLLLSTNDLNPKEIGGTNSARSFSSGFQALIETADTLEARKSDMSPLRRAEQELWQVIAAWHNWMFDEGMLSDKARALGTFSPDFGVDIQYADVKPLESEKDRIEVVKSLKDLGLITKRDALKKLNSQKSDEQIDAMLKEIEEEKKANMPMLMQMAPRPEEDKKPEGDEEDEKPNEVEEEGDGEES